MIEEIKRIVTSGESDETKRIAVLSVIAKDKLAVPHILEMLQEQRVFQDEFIKDINVELSRAHTFIQDTLPEDVLKPESLKHQNEQKKFILKEIDRFYDNNNGFIKHAFRRD